MNIYRVTRLLAGQVFVVAETYAEIVQDIVPDDNITSVEDLGSFYDLAEWRHRHDDDETDAPAEGG